MPANDLARSPETPLDSNGLAAPLLGVLATGVVTWVPVSELLHAAGITDPGAGLDTLASLNLAGWVEISEPDEGELLICLSPLGGDRLGLSVIEQGGQACWTDSPEPETSWPRWHGPEDGSEDPEDWITQVADPRPGPAELVEHADWEASQPPDPYPDLAPPRGRPEDLFRPRPTLILGAGVPWFAVAGVKHRTRREKLPTGLTSRDQVLISAPCPGCGDQPLPPDATCVYPGCDRWGRD